VLERKAPPTFDVIVEIQDREKVLVHADVAATVDAMLLGDPVAPELRWRDEEGVHRSQARPRPTARETPGGDRFSGLTGSGASAWGREPGWRGASTYRTGLPGPEERLPARPGFRSGQSGGWRANRGGSTSPDRGARGPEGDRPGLSVMPGERFAVPPGGPFVAGEIADRGPVERSENGVAPLTAAEVRARDARELERQKAWRAEAARALNALHEDEGTRPVNAAELEAKEEERIARMVPGEVGWDGEEDEAALGAAAAPAEVGTLPTLRVFPHGISRRRLEQAIRDLELPVVIARDPEEADVVMTLRSEYRQKPAAVRDAEDRGLPIYVLKANTIAQMQASLTSVFALEVDPREAALRETEQAITQVIKQQEPIELAPQNAYIRRLQHQMAERANLVSRSRGREPYRRVRLYPDVARPAWR
jgi:R3H domain